MPKHDSCLKKYGKKTIITLYAYRSTSGFVIFVEKRMEDRVFPSHLNALVL